MQEETSMFGSHVVVYLFWNCSLHWSLIIVCHLGSLGRLPGK
jgi:hypothetical protein